MQIEYIANMSMSEACHAIGMEPELLAELVAHGIIAPDGSSPELWRFDLHMIGTAKRALRLQRDLEMDWSAVAMIVELLVERDALRTENSMLRQRLQRFLCD